MTTYGPEHGLTQPNVRVALEDRAGALWVGADGGGLVRVQGGAARSYTVRDGLPNDYVRSLIETGNFDALGHLLQQGVPGARSGDDALARATHRGQVSLREAVAHADDRQRLVSLVRMRARAQASKRAADHERHVPVALAR